MRNPAPFVIFSLFIVLSCWSTVEAQRLSRSGSSPRKVVVRTATSSDRLAFYTAVQRYPYVIARPGDREWLRETPIEQRPNRPMHFWGNSRRRQR